MELDTKSIEAAIEQLDAAAVAHGIELHRVEMANELRGIYGLQPARYVGTRQRWTVQCEIRADNGFGKMRFRMVSESADRFAQAVERMVSLLAAPATRLSMGEEARNGTGQ
jgi:hypothetical protein